MTEVLIIGAGPVGLTMAAELARHGVHSRIVDRLSQPTGYCKALGVTPRTLEVWEDMGVVRPMIDAGLWLTGMRMLVNGQLVKEVSAGLSGYPYACHLGLPQYDTEQILADHLGRFGIVPERGTALLSVEDTGADVAVRLQHADGRMEAVDVSYVIGCDGAHSMVRKAAGIGFPGEAYPVEFMLGDVKVGWDLPRGVAMRAVKLDDGEMTGFLVAVPLPDQGRYRLSSFAPFGPAGPEPGDEHGIQAERTPPSLADLQAVVDRLLLSTTLSDLRWSSIYRISMRIADAYRSGRLFLAGDAAHIHPPTGGQGMNTGIQDAYNLAWKLALVVQGRAPESLLDSYEAERRPVGLDVLERTIAQTQAFREGGKGGGDSRLEDSQLLVNYRGSFWVTPDLVPATEGPAPGDRAPDAGGLRRHGLGMRIRLFDLLHGTDHVLLARVGDLSAAGQVAALATTLRARFGRHLRIYGIAADPVLDDLPGLPVLLDKDGAFAQAYGSIADAAWIIRPDGYVGLRAAELREEDVLRYFEKILRPHGPVS